MSRITKDKFQSVKDILKELNKHIDEKYKLTCLNYGLPLEGQLGVRTPKVRSIAKQTIKDENLAKDLLSHKPLYWELKTIAYDISNPLLCTKSRAIKMAKDCTNWGATDNFTMSFLSKTKHSVHIPLSKEWVTLPNDDDESLWLKRIGFVCIACYGLKSYKLPAEALDNSWYDQWFHLIEEGASDSRHFVKKSISWALRSLGKKNKELSSKAYDTIKNIRGLYPESTSALWIAKDAEKDLNNKFGGSKRKRETESLDEEKEEDDHKTSKKKKKLK